MSHPPGSPYPPAKKKRRSRGAASSTTSTPEKDTRRQHKPTDCTPGVDHNAPTSHETPAGNPGSSQLVVASAPCSSGAAPSKDGAALPEAPEPPATTEDLAKRSAGGWFGNQSAADIQTDVWAWWRCMMFLLVWASRSSRHRRFQPPFGMCVFADRRALWGCCDRRRLAGCQGQAPRP
jgi:hypothetical protein